MANLDSILKSRDIHLLAKVHLVKGMVFPVVIYGYENLTRKNTECQRIDAFKLCCWRRLLRFPWTSRISNQSILKEINPEYSFEGLMLKLQYFGHLMQSQLTGKDPMLKKRPWRQKKRAEEDKMVRCITDSMDMNLSKLWETVEDRGAWCTAVHGVVKSQTRLSDWTLINNFPKIIGTHIFYFNYCNTGINKKQ